jgi:hypothetical protein
MLLRAHEGMQQSVSSLPRQNRVSKERRHRDSEALERLVQLYGAWDKPDEAAKWRQKLERAEVEPKE